MTADKFLDPLHFRRVLARNVTLPLVLGLLGAALFVGVIYYLLDTMRWVEHSAEVLAETREVAQISAEMESGMRGFLNTGNDSTLEQFTAAAGRFGREMASAQQLTGDNASQLARLRTIADLQTQWIAHANELIQKRREGVDLKEILSIGKARVAREQIRAEFERFFAEEQRLSRQRSETAGTTVPLLGGAYLVFTLAIGAILAWVGRRELLKLSGVYSQALETQAADNRRLEDQAWLRTGQSMLATALMGKQAHHTLGRNILEFLAGYLGSQVGAVYVQTEGALKRVAAYGLPPGMDRSEQVFLPAQSLVAEAAARRTPIRLDHPPAGYLRVNSGLGEAAPATVMLVPVENDGVVNGVIELGFLQPAQPRDLELLALVAPNVGSLIEAAHYRQRLQDTLEETQQLNEELQVQQEELRTANEELEEQSRALKESQVHLESQQAELEQTNVQLAEQRDSLDLKNEALNEAQAELESRAGELERASRYKSEFLANMSHELRTPLNSSLILAKLLADNGPGNLSPEQIKFAESIYSAGNDLLNLINDILDIAKVEAGKLDVRPEVTSVASLAESLKRTFEPLAQNKNLKFELQLAAGLPPSLFTDRQRVEQVLKNLLSNAVKFTDRGTVSMAVTRRGTDKLAFEVRDSGIGIAADQQQIIFEAFRQADGTTSRRYGGTGLGLSISRDLAGLLGGGIEVDSAPGKGSRFTLVLPLQYEASQALPAATLAPRPAPAPSLAPAASRAPRPAAYPDDRDRPLAPQQRRVLVVEDEPQFAKILFDLAHELGYGCLVAHHADEAWELAERFVPDAMLLDMRLPDDTGLSVLQKLKDNPRTRHIPVHVISVEDLSEAALHMGAIGYARKPATREELREVFGRLEAKLAQKVKRVLVVEDDALQRESIARLIGDDDIEITAVELGAKALELLRTTHFDCMIIDLKLPDMQGNELLKRMAAEDIQSFPPVIVYTGRNLTRDEEADLMRYSRSIIIKGARSPERLLDEVTLFLHKVESDLSSERQKMLKVARNRDKVFEGRRILIVDDDVRNIFALTSALEHKGANVVVGRNGREALDKLDSTPDIDLVLMDIMMPEMDGYTATREIRKNPRWNKLPIIAVTAKAMKDDQERCLAAGTNDYLAKPIELERLFSLIRVWMPKLERI